jgi:hypothetical protein
MRISILLSVVVSFFIVQIRPIQSQCVPHVLMESERLDSGDSIVNQDADAFLSQQDNGNLVVRRGTPDDPGQLVWETGATGSTEDSSYYTNLQGDSNFITWRVPLDGSGKRVLWKTQTINPIQVYSFVIECDTVAIYRGRPEDGGLAVWRSDPPSPPPPPPLAEVPTPGPTQMTQCLPSILLEVGITVTSGATMVNDEATAFVWQQVNGNFLVQRGTPNNPGQLVWETGVNDSTGVSYSTTLQGDSHLLTKKVASNGSTSFVWRSFTVNPIGEHYFVLECPAAGGGVAIYQGRPNDNGSSALWRSTPSPIIPTSPSPVSSPTTPQIPLMSFGGNPPPSIFPLSHCQGDCDNDGHCESGLVCFQRNSIPPSVPGCIGNDQSNTDYCIYEADIPVEPSAEPLPTAAPFILPTAAPFMLPTPPEGSVTYQPGNLTTLKDDLLISEGLDSRLLATTGNMPMYADGTQSEVVFHGRPDAGACFPDERPENPGGWVYVSNAEVRENGMGGVGALTFDSSGNLLAYKMVLEGSTWNCGGGRTPFNTWVSCEERGGGVVWQVDPFGEREPEIVALGETGSWESFTHDIRDPSRPQFFITEDASDGALRRFTPRNPLVNNGWDMLHEQGDVDYLKLSTDGTFEWISDQLAAKDNAAAFYPFTEGIDFYGSNLYFVCKKIQFLYILDLDAGTWTRTSTVSGLFSGQPDQIQRLLGDTEDLLYFTEEGGRNSGIHARDSLGRFFTIMESPVHRGETAGLSLSPDGKFLYVAYQEVGKLYCLWRRDGKPFDALHLDVNFHAA